MKKILSTVLLIVLLAWGITTPTLNASAATNTGWKKVNGNWYYYTSKGKVTGWFLTGGKWYFFDSNGLMKTGWVYTGKKWYYLNSSGDMQTGWGYVNGKQYYFYASGMMAVNTTVDGTTVGSDGWVIPAPNDLDIKIKQILAEEIHPGMTDLQKIVALHDYLILHTKYDWTNYNNNTVPDISYTSAGALLKGVAVCDGYSHALNDLLEAAGIDSTVIYGEIMNIEHAWNRVKLNGRYYNIDSTLDDGSDLYPGYSYFLKSDAFMKKTHAMYGNIVATDTSFDSDFNFSNLVKDGNYYYLNEDYLNLIRMNLDGTNQKKIASNAFQFIATNGYIFYVPYPYSDPSGQIPFEAPGIYKIQEDGAGDVETVMDEQQIMTCLDPYGGYIKLLNYEDGYINFEPFDYFTLIKPVGPVLKAKVD